MNPVSVQPTITAPSKPVYEAVKRLFDFCAALGALLILSPLFLLIALLIWIDDPAGSPFYVSTRCGKYGKEFRFYKFRSRVVHADQMLDSLLQQNEMDGPVFKIREDPRITKIGKFLRKTSLDELPQLFNVLKGDMSLVGPRPPLPREVAQYTPYQRSRLEVTPGLTCFWQVSPRRNDLTFDQWVELDIRYIHQRSFWLDIKLILQTVLVMITREGV